MELLIAHIKAVTEEVEMSSHLFLIYQRLDERDARKIAAVHQEEAGVCLEGQSSLRENSFFHFFLLSVSSPAFFCDRKDLDRMDLREYAFLGICLTNKYFKQNIYCLTIKRVINYTKQLNDNHEKDVKLNGACTK